jgi:hypothetical protein
VFVDALATVTKLSVSLCVFFVRHFKVLIYAMVLPQPWYQVAPSAMRAGWWWVDTCKPIKRHSEWPLSQPRLAILFTSFAQR